MAAARATTPRYRFLPSLRHARKQADGSDGWGTLTPKGVATELRARKPTHTRTQPRTFCEFLRYVPDDAAWPGLTKLYLDRDVPLPQYADPNVPPPEEVVAAHRRDVDDAVRALLDVLSTEHVEGDDGGALGDVGAGRGVGPLTYVVATRHGWWPKQSCWKVSFRPFVQGLTVRYTDIPQYVRVMGQEEFWDVSVYKPGEQLLGCINCVKGDNDADARVLLPQPGFEDPLLYVAQHVEPTWPVRVLPEVYIADDHNDGIRAGAGAGEAGGRGWEGGDEHDAYVRGLVGCLADARAVKRDQWIAVAHVLKREGLEVYDDDARYFDLFVAFSRRGGSAFKGEHDCRRTWRSINVRASPSSSSKPVGLGTLRYHAKADNPARYAEMAAEHLSGNQVRAAGQADDTDAAAGAALTRVLNQCFPTSPLVARIAGKQLRVKPCAAAEEGIICRFEDGAGTTGWITAGGGVMVDDDHFVGMLSPNVPIKGPLSFVHSDIHPDVNFVYNQKAADRGVLESVTVNMGARLTMYNMDDPANGIMRLSGTGKREIIINNAKKMAATRQRVYADVREHLRRTLGSALGDAPLVFQNFGTINVNSGSSAADDDEKKRLSDKDIAQLLVDAAPDVTQRIRLAPSLKSTNCNGIFMCDAATGVWKQRPNVVVERVLLSALEREDIRKRMSAVDIRHVESRRGTADLVHCVSRQCTDEDLRDKLDANLDLFAVRNGVFDMVVKAFRATRPDDYVQMTAGWEYDPAKAAEHRPALDKFLATVVPVAEERDVMLAYFASLMSGRRKVKKFAVLTDRRAGNNGKSTLLRLMERFFGEYTENSTKFVCRGSFDRDRNDHDAALEPLRGKRLLIAEELRSSMQLDDAMLKQYSGGAGVVTTGRACGQAEQFKFVWQAGIVLVFNEGGCPKFDAADQAFTERMLVVPMRSKFVPATELQAVGGDAPEYTYAMDTDIMSRFDTWMPALADLLLQHCDHLEARCAALPASMKEWRSDVAAASNPLSDWLDRHTEVTRTRADYLVLGAVEKQYARHRQEGVGMPQLKHGDFKRYVWAYMTQHGATCIDGVSHVGGSTPSARNVIRGVKWRQDEVQDVVGEAEA